MATYLISFLPACYHLRSQPASERALTLFRIKVRVCSLETFVSVILWVYASRQKKIGTSCAACASAGALFLSASVRISLQCINCSPIANIFAHIYPPASSFPLRLTWTCPALASYLGTGNFGFMVGCSQNRPPI